MKNKYVYLASKVVFSLIILIPIVSQIGILLGFDIPAKREYYNTDKAFAFIEAIVASGYIAYLDALVFIIGLLLMWTKRTAVAAVIMFPVTVNVFAFHALLDGGPFTSGALLGNIMLAINLYFFWYHWGQYKELLSKDVA